MSSKELVPHTSQAITPEIVSPHEAQLGMAATPVGEAVLQAHFEDPIPTGEDTTFASEPIGSAQPGLSRRTEKGVLAGLAVTTALTGSIPSAQPVSAAAEAMRPTSSGHHLVMENGMPSMQATAMDRFGNSFGISVGENANPATETNSAIEKALEPGSKFRLDLMTGTSDGNVTIGLVMDNDGKQHLVVGDKDLVFTDMGEFNVPIAAVAINDKNPKQFAVAGSIGRGRDIGYVKYFDDGKVVELDGSKQEVVALGGMRGAKRGLQYVDGVLVVTGSSGSNTDLNPYVTEIITTDGNPIIKHSKVEGMEGTLSFTSLSGFSPIPERPGHSVAWVTTVPTSGVARVTRTPDGYSGTQVLTETSQGFIENDANQIFSYRNQVSGRGRNDPNKIFGTISEVIGNSKMGEFQIPQNLLNMDFTAVSISGGAKIPGENAYYIGLTLFKGNDIFAKLMRMDVARDGTKSFRLVDIADPQWSSNAYINGKGVKVSKSGTDDVIDTAFGAMADGSRGRIVRTINGKVQQVGNIGPRQTRPIEYRHKVFAPMQGKNVIPSRIAPK